jgi:hypothetical protein
MKEPKQLQRALGMVGVSVNEEQSALVLAFMEVLDRKGQATTLGDIELIGQRIRGEYAAKESIVKPGAGGRTLSI